MPKEHAEDSEGEEERVYGKAVEQNVSPIGGT